jgi:hypothetical protein
MNTQEEFDDLKNDAPKLHSMDKKNPFVVPEHYFETLSSRIQDRITLENKQPQWIKILKSLLLPKVAIPALACCLMLGIGIKYLVKPAAVTVTEETAITYDELNSTEYINMLDEEQIVTAIAEQKEATTTTTEIEDYLIENNVDESELISALN